MARRPAAYALLDKMNVAQLEQTRSHIDALIARKRAEGRERLMETLKAEASKQGFALDELFGRRGKPAAAGKVAIKYRHPKDPSLTWSGRGRPSKWLAELISKGHSRDEFAV